MEPEAGVWPGSGTTQQSDRYAVAPQGNELYNLCLPHTALIHQMPAQVHTATAVLNQPAAAPTVRAEAL